MKIQDEHRTTWAPVPLLPCRLCGSPAELVVRGAQIVRGAQTFYGACSDKFDLFDFQYCPFSLGIGQHPVLCFERRSDAAKYWNKVNSGVQAK